MVPRSPVDGAAPHPLAPRGPARRRLRRPWPRSNGRPTAGSTEFRHHLAVHHGVGPALVGHAPLHGNVSGEVGGPGPERQRDDRFGQCARQIVECRIRGPDHGCPYVGHERGQRSVVEGVGLTVQEMGATLVMDRGGRQTGLDQLHLRRSRTWWSAVAETATAQPRWCAMPRRMPLSRPLPGGRAGPRPSGSRFSSGPR